MKDTEVKNKNHKIIPIFIPELACPHQCVFCNQEKISGQLSIPDANSIISTIETHLSTIDEKRSRIEIAFFGGNFTGIPINQQKEFLDIAQIYIDQKMVDGIRLSTRPDYISKEVMDFLKCYNISDIELGAQSMDRHVLIKSGRGHSVEDIVCASLLIKEYGIELGLQMMIGLPGDTFQKSLNTAKQIIGLGADNARIYPALVISDTKMAEMYSTGKFTPLSMDEAIKWSKELLLLFEKNNVTVLRVGLHPSEGLLNGCELVAGPFHQSFKEFVVTEIWLDKLKNYKFDYSKNKIQITVAKSEFNYAIGYSAKNKKVLLENFNVVKFTADPTLKGREFHVDYN